MELHGQIDLMSELGNGFANCNEIKFKTKEK